MTKEIVRYSLSKDKVGLLAYFADEHYYHIHSNELSFLEKWIHRLLVVGEQTNQALLKAGQCIQISETDEATLAPVEEKTAPE